MCATCGCSDDSSVHVIDLRTGAGHHDHDHTHPHSHNQASMSTTLTLQERVLAKNDALAEHNRGWLEARNIAAVNVMSSPGSGKTTLLARTVRELGAEVALHVVEGDQETTLDAQRLEAAGCPVVQVNTGAGCHLDASMFAEALHALNPDAGIVLIENVGNLVCPALFDLGENARVVITSVTEGADKPLKYPHMFRTATLVLLNKIDLLPHVDFDIDAFHRNVALINPTAQLQYLSATRGDGLDTWYTWVRARVDSSICCAVPTTTETTSELNAQATDPYAGR